MSAFKIGMKYLFAAIFIFAGFNHFRDPEFYLRIMLPYLPWPSALHLTAGFFEVLLGVMLLILPISEIGRVGIDRATPGHLSGEHPHGRQSSPVS